MIAYEPVWAIGKGVTPSTEEIKVFRIFLWNRG